MLKTGFRIGDYQIQSRLGAGGMSIVYRAIDGEGKTVVVKAMTETLAARPEAVARFEREARLISRLEHPHIVRVFDFIVVDDVPYMVMEFKEGGNLAQYLQRHGLLTLGAAAILLQQLASALDYAHAQHIIHRDIKLENVLLDSQGQAALSDFGLARALDESTLTATGSLLGTPYYMSPEQLQPTRYKVDHRADYYALGILGYVLATGQFPFFGSDAAAIMHQQIASPPPAPTEVNPALPAEIDPVLLRALSKDPEVRYPTASAFADEFALAIIRHLALPVECKILPRSSNISLRSMLQKATTVPGATLPHPQPGRFRRWLPAALITALVFVVLVQSAFLVNPALNPFLPPSATPSPTPSLPPQGSPPGNTQGGNLPLDGGPGVGPEGGNAVIINTLPADIPPLEPGNPPVDPDRSQLRTITVVNNDGPMLILYVDGLPRMVIPHGYTGSFQVLAGNHTIQVCDALLRNGQAMCPPPVRRDITNDMQWEVPPRTIGGGTLNLVNLLQPESTPDNP